MHYATHCVSPCLCLPGKLAESVGVNVRSLGGLGARNRLLAGVYIAVFFFGLPLLLLFVTGTL